MGFAGFIEFIVDPSFQVMGDMLEKVLTPLHQQQSSRATVDEAISEEVFESRENKRDKGTSTSETSRPNTPRTPLSPCKAGTDLNLAEVFVSLFEEDFLTYHIVIIIINNPLTARVVGAPQMILQPVLSIFPCSPLPSGTCRTPGLSIP